MSKKTAFTLIELLVVISIIALLMGVLLPVLRKARESARRAVCVSTIKSFGLANASYASASDGWYVPFSQESKDPDHVSPNGDYWDERWPENKVYRSCLAVNKKVEDSGWEDPFIFPQGLTCPSHKMRYDEDWLKLIESQLKWKARNSYAMNTERWADVWYPNERKYRGHHSLKVKRPSECMMFIDGNLYRTILGKAKFTLFWDKYGDDIGRYSREEDFGGKEPDYFGQVCYRHDEGACLVYFDGHADYLKKEDIFDTSIRLYPLDPLRRQPIQLWDVEYPLVYCEGGECAGEP